MIPGHASASVFDVAIIGGGVNGCGIARDAAGRGLRVALFEQNDLGGATSAASTKLIHGGLRYLEHFKFRLVREALIEREVILKLAPHIVWPLRFVLPHHRGLRPAWLLRLGLFLYDTLGGRQILRGTRTIDLTNDARGAALKPEFKKGFEYSDCWVEDSRLVTLNACDAFERGAEIHVRSKVLSATREQDVWRLVIEDGETGAAKTICARTLVNAAGPWVGSVLTGVVRSNTPEKVRMVQGSHIVVKKLYDHDRCYIFQNADDRIIFAIPYERDFTLIGTTDQDFTGDPGAVRISEAEIQYLCAAASEYFRNPIAPSDVVWTYSGVRPLYDDGASKAQEATRDYLLTLDHPTGGAPLLNVFGGKITTYRKLAEAALEKLSPFLPQTHTWTETAALPGGDFPHDGFDELVSAMRRRAPFAPVDLVRRWVRAYGTRTQAIVEKLKESADLGRCFGADLYECEVRYLVSQEFCRRAEDILWRRSKLGLRFSADQAHDLDAFVAQLNAQPPLRVAS
jgi:glycerol-3-phosphate dehydrogenase